MRGLSALSALALCPAAYALVAPVSPKRVRFLFSDTGGGHRASAESLRDALEASYPGAVECDLVDMFVESGQPLYKDYPAIYKTLADNPWSWKLLFEVSSLPLGILIGDLLQEAACYSAFLGLLGKAPRPDCVVSVHPLLQTVPLKALAELDGGERTTPFVTVTTDLGGAHPLWFNPAVDKCYVPSGALRELAAGRGLGASQIVQFGLPIRRGFWAGAAGVEAGIQPGAAEWADPKDAVRAALGLETGRLTALVVGGGDGMGGITATATAIADRLRAEDAETQVVVVCGRNRAAVDELAASADASRWSPKVSVRVVGFVDNMEQYMGAADVLVTKAGPGTIAEASAMGLPCVLSNFLPGQEAGNVDYVRQMGFGEYTADPAEIADLVAGYLRDDEARARMAAAAREAARPEATMDIANDIARLAGVA